MSAQRPQLNMLTTSSDVYFLIEYLLLYVHPLLFFSNLSKKKILNLSTCWLSEYHHDG